MNSRAAPLGALFRLNTHLLLNCFDGGQLAMLRRAHGLPGMRYSTRE